MVFLEFEDFDLRVIRIRLYELTHSAPACCRSKTQSVYVLGVRVYISNLGFDCIVRSIESRTLALATRIYEN